MGQGEGAGFAASALGGAAKGQGKEAELGEEEGRGVRSTRYLRRTLVGSRTARPKGLQGRAGARMRPQPGLPGTLGTRGGLTHPAPCFSPKRAGWGAPCPPPPPAQPSPNGLQPLSASHSCSAHAATSQPTSLSAPIASSFVGDILSAWRSMGSFACQIQRRLSI